jgi:hypothetical protein
MSVHSRCGPNKAIEIERIVDQQLQAEIVGGSFPASDPISATQPSPSMCDEGKESRNECRKHRPEGMIVMDYCGVEFTAIQLNGSSLWKWQLLILNDDKMRSCGEAATREAAISQAHEAIGDGLRANAGPDDDDAQLPELVRDILHVLNGARGLPSAEAVEALRPFLNTMSSRASGIDVLADASADAVGALVQRLEATGIATDDLWEEAIEASLSFANETGFRARSVLEG